MDRGIFITWYDLPEDGRDEHHDWTHNVYIPRILELPGCLWAAHYASEDNVVLPGQKDRLSHTDNPGVGSGDRFILIFGGGHVDTSGGLFATAGLLKRHKKGKVVILAVAAAKRDKHVPGVPTFRELGVDFVYQLWRGFLALKGTPQDRIDIITKALYATMKDKSFKKLMKKVGSPANPLHGVDFKKMIAAEHKQFGGIFKQLGLKKK